MYLGGNLTYPSPTILINDLTALDMGLFTDSQKGSQKVLHFKKLGLGIPSISGKTTIDKSNYVPGALQGSLVKLDNVCPCEECNFEYGLSIIRKVKNPGIRNSYVEDESRHYTGKLSKVQPCTNGLMADADLLTMEDDILSQIKLDDGSGSDEGAIVDAFRAYILTTSAADISGDAVTLTYTSSAGGATELTLNAATAELNAAIINDNATVGAAVRAFAIGTSKIMIVGITEGDNFTFAHADSALVTSLYRYIYIVGNDVKFKYEISYDKGFATVTPISIFTIDVSTDTVTSLSVTWGNGSWTTATAAADDVAALVAEINSDIAASDAYCGSESGADSTWIKITSVGTQPLDVKVADLGTVSTLVIDERVTGEGRYEMFTSDDVFREFANKHFSGAVAAHHYHKFRPIEGAEYWKLVFTTNLETYNLEGASHGNTYAQQVTLYIRKSAANFSTDIFEDGAWMSDSPTADKYFGDLLEEWLTGSAAALGLPTS